jgi:MFS family permease
MPAQLFAHAQRGPWLRYVGYLSYVGIVTGALYTLYGGWSYDDPYIAYRYVRNLVNGAGFVYNPGEQVLSTTSPLYVLLLAALSPLSSFLADLPHLSNLIGCVCLACGGLLLWDLARCWKPPWAGWAGLTLYPTFPLLAASLGSEMPLYLALCLGAFASYARSRYYLAAIFSALAILARPDGVLLALILAVDYLICQRKPFSWRALAWFGVIVLPWIIFAGVYFGSPIPVTLAAKQYQGSMAISQRFPRGFLTTFSPFLRWPYFWLALGLAGTGFILSFWSWRRWSLLWAWSALYFTGYSLLGVSRYFWYYIPLVPGFIGAIGLGLEAIQRASGSIRHSAPRGGTGNVLAGLTLLALFWGQGQHLWRQAQANDLRYPVFRLAGEWLAEDTPPGASVGALEIGVLGYYADRPIVDFAGLVQPDVAVQLQDSASYEAAAQWAIEHYSPDYLVLREGLFRNIVADYVARNCRVVQDYPANSTPYPWAVSIYACGSDD